METAHGFVRVGHTTTNTYDQRDRLLTTADANNQVTKYAYDQSGNQIRVTDPLGHTSQKRYDARNRLIVYRRYLSSDPLWVVQDIFRWFWQTTKLVLVEQNRTEKLAILENESA